MINRDIIQTMVIWSTVKILWINISTSAISIFSLTNKFQKTMCEQHSIMLINLIDKGNLLVLNWWQTIIWPNDEKYYW